MTSGIYRIHCKINDKSYVGSSVNIEHRISKHKSQLKNNRHENIHLQRAYNKYGKNSFEYLVIEEISKDENILSVEQKYLDTEDNLFNIGKLASGGDNLSNNTRKNEIIEKIKKTLKNKYSSMSQEEIKRKFSRPMESNPNWKGGKTYCSCGKKINNTTSSCSKCMNKKGESNGFYGKKHSDKTKAQISLKNRGKKPSNCNRVRINGIDFASQNEASKYFGVSSGTISNWVSGKTKAEGMSIQKHPS